MESAAEKRTLNHTEVGKRLACLLVFSDGYALTPVIEVSKTRVNYCDTTLEIMISDFFIFL